MDKENVAITAPTPVEASPRAKVKSRSSPLQKGSLLPNGVSFPSTSKPGDPTDDQDTEATAPGAHPKRAPLVYPSSALAAQSNQKPFSRSAAKRESVMALGSIGYLQHMYAKQGIASKNRPVTKGPLTLAIGRAGESMLAAIPPTPDQSPLASKAKLNEDIAEEETEGQSVLVATPQDDTFDLPPSPKAPTNTRLPYPTVAKPVEADAEALWPVMLEELDTTCQLWGLLSLVSVDKLHPGGRRLSMEPDSRRPSSRASNVSVDGAEPDTASASVDLLGLINTTTKTIRSVRNYLLALPPASLNDKLLLKASNGPRSKDQFKRQSSFSSLSRRSSLTPVALDQTYGTLARRVSSPQQAANSSERSMPSAWQTPKAARASSDSPANDGISEEDPLTLVRKSALEVLGALRAMEEKHRLPAGHPDYENVNADIEGTGKELGLGVDLEPRNMTANASTQGLMDLGNSSSADLSLGMSPDKAVDGYLYRDDLKLADLSEERETVSSYLTTVDRVLSRVQRPRAAKRASQQPPPSSRLEESAEAVASITNPEITVSSVKDTGMMDPDPDMLSAPQRQETIPAWAHKGEYPGGETGRVRAFLLAHLPPDVGLELMQVSTEVTESSNALDISKEKLLMALVDGSLLCNAYNQALLQSGRPWGFIQAKEIHDLKADEAQALEKQREMARKAREEAKPFEVKDGNHRRDASSADEPDQGQKQKQVPTPSGTLQDRPGWTFRRAENLRVWAAALRLRYQIQTTSMSSLETLQPPSLPGLRPPTKLGLHPRRVFSETAATVSRSEKAAPTTMTPTTGANPDPSQMIRSTSASGAEAIEFDARKVARKGEGWQDMLFTLVVRWIQAVASEERGEDSL